MNRAQPRYLAWTAGLFVVAAGSGGAQEPADTVVERGVLSRGHPRAEWYYQSRFVELAEGYRWRFELVSSDFPPLLVLRPPAGEERVVEPLQDGSGRAIAEVDVAHGGLWEVVVGSDAPGRRGTYALRRHAVRRLTGDRPIRTVARERAWRATFPLRTSPTAHEIVLAPGDHVAVTVVSDDFDPVLTARVADGSELFNDDWAGVRVSRIDYTASEADHLDLSVESFGGGGSGQYWLEVLVTDQKAIDGSLDAPGDAVPIRVPLDPVHGVIVEVASDMFDTVLSAGPDGPSNDDWLCRIGTSRVLVPASPRPFVTLTVSAYGGRGRGPFTVRTYPVPTVGPEVPAIECR